MPFLHEKVRVSSVTVAWAIQYGSKTSIQNFLGPPERSDYNELSILSLTDSVKKEKVR